MPDTTDNGALIESLRDPRRFGADVQAVDLIETHISWVLLTGRYAYKIKKPVTLPFVDFSTLEKRKHFCEEEIRINRRLAPEIYLSLETIGGTPSEPILGERPAIEYAVKMRQFAPDGTLDRMLARDAVPIESIRELAELIAKFHDAEPPTEGALGDAAALKNLSELGDALSAGQQQGLPALRRWTEEQCAALGAALEARRDAGAIRECHGDLHLKNLVMTQERIVPFDALEFDRSLRCIDVMNEVGFLVMDLMAHRRNDLAFEFLTRYLEHTGDYGGLRVLRFFLVYRALVRAKVDAIAAGQHAGESAEPEALADAARYLALAGSLIDAQRPLLAITHGLSGSGKTTVSDALIGSLPAVRLRSDLERKRLHGLTAAARTHSGLAQGIYGEEATARTYAALADGAACGLAAGFDVIVDAAFLERERRDAFAALARDNGAAFAILDVTAPESVLRRRLAARAQRGQDASEAGTAVLDYQLEHGQPLAEAERAHCRRVETQTAGGDYGALAQSLRRAAR